MKIKLKTHSFSTKVAEDVGILPAVILYNIYFWVDYNEKNGTNYYEGHYWSYNSIAAFQRQFSYVTQKQIRTALEKLRNEGKSFDETVEEVLENEDMARDERLDQLRRAREHYDLAQQYRRDFENKGPRVK